MEYLENCRQPRQTLFGGSEGGGVVMVTRTVYCVPALGQVWCEVLWHSVSEPQDDVRSEHYDLVFSG